MVDDHIENNFFANRTFSDWTNLNARGEVMRIPLLQRTNAFDN